MLDLEDQPQPRAFGSSPTTTTTTTTTSIARLKGLTLDILEYLNQRPLTVPELAEFLQRNSNYIRPYLYNMKRYGLTDKLNIGAWTLTTQGESYYTYIHTSTLIVKERRKKEERSVKDPLKKEERSVKDPLKKEETSAPTRQISIEPWLRQSDPGEIEVVVVQYLVDHYTRTGRKYILVGDQFDLAERFNCSPDHLREALAKLDEERRIYFTQKPDPRYGKHRLALQKRFIEWLENGGI